MIVFGCDDFDIGFQRRYHYEQKLACLQWKVDIRDVIVTCSNMKDSAWPSVALSQVAADCRSLSKSAMGSGNNNNSNGSLPASDSPDGLPLPVAMGLTNGDFHQHQHQPSVVDVALKRAYTRTGRYKGNVVAVKALSAKNIDLTRNICKELKQVMICLHSACNNYLCILWQAKRNFQTKP